ncbi:hypothetical protein E2C01_042772 [Portunus trituberculatus]|uniref:Uncharacterized protein n=1 Tax=Portunus trituberculatus TaxID=210409 RepID=A0A5B7FUG5_PORTR|nr:hypothetical protein [Portunus trituberculatus]
MCVEAAHNIAGMARWSVVGSRCSDEPSLTAGSLPDEAEGRLKDDWLRALSFSGGVRHVGWRVGFYLKSSDRPAAFRGLRCPAATQCVTRRLSPRQRHTYPCQDLRAPLKYDSREFAARTLVDEQLNVQVLVRRKSRPSRSVPSHPCCRPTLRRASHHRDSHALTPLDETRQDELRFKRVQFLCGSARYAPRFSTRVSFGWPDCSRLCGESVL